MSNVLPGLTLPKFAQSKDYQLQNYVETNQIYNLQSPERQNLLKSKNPLKRISPTLPYSPIIPSIGIVNNIIPVTERIHCGFPRTPLVIPNIGILKGIPMTPEKSLNTDENPWLPPKTDGISDVKITAITPIGTIAMVPTCDKRPPSTPRKLPPTPGHLTLNIIGESSYYSQTDPLLSATIFLDCTKPEDRDYNYVSERMRKITANTINLQKQYSTELKLLTNAIGRVSNMIFEESLSIYENNQVYYQDRLDDQKIDIDSINLGLTTLEHWFMCIIEPRPRDDIDAWRIRELSKLQIGFSFYCDPELHKHIQTLPSHISNLIKQYQAGIL
jgi:hypothetical protein